MNEQNNFEHLICKTIDQIYNENMRLYRLCDNREWLDSAWHNLNGLHFLLEVYEVENKQSTEVYMRLIKLYQDKIRGHIKDHNNLKVK